MMTILTNYHLFLTLYTFILFSINIQFIFITPVLSTWQHSSIRMQTLGYYRMD